MAAQAQLKLPLPFEEEKIMTKVSVFSKAQCTPSPTGIVLHFLVWNVAVPGGMHAFFTTVDRYPELDSLSVLL